MCKFFIFIKNEFDWAYFNVSDIQKGNGVDQTKGRRQFRTYFTYF
jgi:hypothetical protein